MSLCRETDSVCFLHYAWIQQQVKVVTYVYVSWVKCEHHNVTQCSFGKVDDRYFSLIRGRKPLDICRS